MSMDTYQRIRWVLRQPILDDLNVALSSLALRADHAGVACLAPATLAAEIGETEERVIWMCEELDAIGLIRRSPLNGRGQPSAHSWHIEFHTELDRSNHTELDRSNPLMGLLQERVLEMEGLTHGERWALLTLSRLYDRDRDRSIVSYKQVVQIMPFWKDQGRNSWKMLLNRLVHKGMIRCLYSAPNHHIASEWELTIAESASVKMTPVNEESLRGTRSPFPPGHISRE